MRGLLSLIISTMLIQEHRCIKHVDSTSHTCMNRKRALNGIFGVKMISFCHIF